eukprot:58719-Pyramimonas_sp.AAC.1
MFLIAYAYVHTQPRQVKLPRLVERFRQHLSSYLSAQSLRDALIAAVLTSENMDIYMMLQAAAICWILHSRKQARTGYNIGSFANETPLAHPRVRYIKLRIRRRNGWKHIQRPVLDG